MVEEMFTQISNYYDLAYLNTKNWLHIHGPDIIIILIVSWLTHLFASKFVSSLLHHTVRADLYPSRVDRERRLKTIEGLVGVVLRIVVYGVAFVLIIGEFGINTGPLIASAGVLGIALGFGAQSLIKDFTSGIFIIIDNQYRVGDFVTIDKVSGTVEAVTIRTTILRDLDGSRHHIANGSILVATNQTVDFGGISEDILIGKTSNIDKVRDAVNKVGQEMLQDKVIGPKIKEAPYFDRVLKFDKNGIFIRVLGTTGANDQIEVVGNLYERLLTEFRHLKIELPDTKISVAK
ncbi:MAG: mechanosensitive ion channel family protein [Patescibacteria group bacterium]